MKLLISLSFLLAATQVKAKAVFAHFMVGNVPSWDATSWEADVLQAQEAGIDAFALNIAYTTNATAYDIVATSVAYAFTAAQSLGFQLFFSFDYAGGDAGWPQYDVISYLNQYGGNSAYFTYGGQPFVSTFEGPDASADWTEIKSQTGCFFMPDWSSKGAKAALALTEGVPDGLFSWAAWPWGDEDMNTYVDASYLEYLDGLPYMMPVSPWFYTNLPGYDKNWLWRGDDLWYDRWQEVIYLQPEFVEIISWNDYGESHYIGPLYLNELDGILGSDTGEAPFDFVTGMAHDGWRYQLPFLIETYKNNISTITQESIVAWFRPQPAAACDDGDTSGNTHTQFQIEFAATDVVQDKVFYSALLGSSGTPVISVGGASVTGTWSHTPAGGIGLYHGSVDFPGTGDVVVSITRDGSTVMSADGASISTDCTDGYENFNAHVISVYSSSTISATPKYRTEEMVCVAGTGAGNFEGLCEFACSYGYCPVGACLCTDMGPQADLPDATGVQGYPISGEDASYSGLCSFCCNYDYCPPTSCGTTEVALATPTVSPFLPDACIAGEDIDNEGLAGLCSYSCNYGMCPIDICTCTGEGALNDAPDQTVSGTFKTTMDSLSVYDLCNFACTRGYCPDPCYQEDELSTGSDSDTCNTYISSGDGPTIWHDAGAEAALQAYITANGAKSIDVGIASMFNYDIESNCGSLTDETDCPVPSDCPSDDEIAYFFIYQAFSHHHSLSMQFYNELVYDTIINQLSVADLISAFSLTIQSDTFDASDVMAGLGGALGIASAALSLSQPELSAITGVSGGILSTVSGFTSPDDTTASFINNVTGVFDDRIKITLEQYRAGLGNASLDVFSKGDVSSFPDASLEYDTSNSDNSGITSGLSKLFADGKFSMPVDGGNFTILANDMLKYFQWNLLGFVLTTANVYILQDPFHEEDCTDYSGHWLLIDGNSASHCYTIEYPGVGNTEDRGSGERSTYSKPLSDDQMAVFSSYDLDFSDIVTSSIQCQKTRNKYLGAGDYSLPTTTDSLPLCLFNIPVFDVSSDGLDGELFVASTPCYLQQGYNATDSSAEVGINYLPEYLADVFTTAFCSTEGSEVSSTGGGGTNNPGRRWTRWFA